MERPVNGDAPTRRGRPRRQVKTVVESDESGDDDDDDADFHAAEDTSEEKESELDDEDDDDEEVEEPEEESDSNAKARRKSKNGATSAAKKPSVRGAKKPGKASSGAGVGLKGSSLAKDLSGRITIGSGRLEPVRGISNDFTSDEY